VRRRALLGLAAGGVALFRLSGVAAKRFTDAAGREVDLPDRVERVFAAGPPASLILFMVAPEKNAGLGASSGREGPRLPAAAICGAAPDQNDRKRPRDIPQASAGSWSLLPLRSNGATREPGT
jgi:hypothetical protein